MDEGEEFKKVEPRQFGITEAAGGASCPEKKVRRIGGAPDRLAARYCDAVDPDAGVGGDESGVGGHQISVDPEQGTNNYPRTNPPRLCLPHVCRPDRNVTHPSAAPVWRRSWKLNGSTSDAAIAAALPIGAPPAQWR